MEFLPRKIWLQVGNDDGSPLDLDDLPGDDDCVTWCATPINEGDACYVLESELDAIRAIEERMGVGWVEELAKALKTLDIGGSDEP